MKKLPVSCSYVVRKFSLRPYLFLSGWPGDLRPTDFHHPKFGGPLFHFSFFSGRTFHFKCCSCLIYCYKGMLNWISVRPTFWSSETDFWFSLGGVPPLTDTQAPYLRPWSRGSIKNLSNWNPWVTTKLSFKFCVKMDNTALPELCPHFKKASTFIVCNLLHTYIQSPCSLYAVKPSSELSSRFQQQTKVIAQVGLYSTIWKAYSQYSTVWVLCWSNDISDPLNWANKSVFATHIITMSWLIYLGLSKELWFHDDHASHLWDIPGRVIRGQNRAWCG